MKENIIKFRYKLKIIVITLFVILFLFILFPILFITLGEDEEFVRDSSFESVLRNDLSYEEAILEDKVNVFFDKDTSFNKGKTKLTLEKVIFSDNLYDLVLKIEELIYYKYPVFIANELINESTVKEYYLDDNGLIVKFSDYMYEDELNNLELIIYYKDIHDYLKIDVAVDETKESESGFDYDKDKPTVAITFDDGPHPVYTEAFISSLEDNKAMGTFFMLGLNVENYPSIVKQVFESGNEIAMHGYSHTNFTRMGINEIEAELNKTNEMIHNITGKYSNLVRPPYGSINNNMKNSFNYAYVLWNVDTDDWRFKDIDRMVNHVIENAKDGDIILMHDIFYESSVAIEKILQGLYLKGFQVTSVTGLAELHDYEISLNQSFGYFPIA